ncbi:MAG: haloacid dehalogenase-like hydrolase [Chloroflexota bacterium]|nr:haloacid dehalogenase-like hydrolase [Chloroflexota bacterium]MDE2910924.1 haloacid dehalogenase-like hydrolase [Chloroflexota bacterium]
MKLVLFDIDGTLLISRGIGRHAKRQAMLECFGRTGDLDNHVFGGKTDWRIVAELLAPYGVTSDEVGRAMPAYETVMARHMRALRGRYQAEAIPHALELVGALREREDALLGLVTGNTSKTAAIKLEMAGYDRGWFPLGAFGNESAERDDLTRLALRRAGEQAGRPINGSDVVVIGDTPDDVKAARAIDAIAVAVCTGYVAREQLAGSEPDFLLADLSAFFELVPL